MFCRFRCSKWVQIHLWIANIRIYRRICNSEVSETRWANEMILLRAYTLIEILHAFLSVAPDANTVFLRVGLECAVKLWVSWASHAWPTHVKVTCFTAREEILLVFIYGIVTDVTVKLSAVSLQRPTIHSSDLWVVKVSLFQWMCVSTANSGRLVLGSTASQTEVFIAICSSITSKTWLILGDTRIAIRTS